MGGVAKVKLVRQAEARASRASRILLAESKPHPQAAGNSLKTGIILRGMRPYAKSPVRGTTPGPGAGAGWGESITEQNRLRPGVREEMGKACRNAEKETG